MHILPKDLLADIDKFLSTSGTSPTAFGKEAVNDGHFVRRLRDGVDMRLSTIRRAHEYLVAQTTERRSDAA